MFEYWNRTNDIVDIQPADRAFPEINVHYANGGKTGSPRLMTLLAQHPALVFLYMEDQYGLANAQVVHQVFQHDGKWYAIKETKACPYVMPIEGNFIGPTTNPTKLVPTLDALLDLDSAAPNATTKTLLRHGVILIPTVMSALEEVNLNDFSACFVAVSERFQSILSSQHPQHLWTKSPPPAREMAAFKKYATTVLQWMYLGLVGSNGDIPAKTVGDESVPNIATATAKGMLRRLAEEPEDDIQSFADSNEEN
jgi:hypothetical protein